jgi:hypothetical protein
MWRMSATPLGADQNEVTIGEGDAMLVKRTGSATKFIGLETSADASE